MWTGGGGGGGATSNIGSSSSSSPINGRRSTTNKSVLTCCLSPASSSLSYSSPLLTSNKRDHKDDSDDDDDCLRHHSDKTAAYVVNATTDTSHCHRIDHHPSHNHNKHNHESNLDERVCHTRSLSKFIPSLDTGRLAQRSSIKGSSGGGGGGGGDGPCKRANGNCENNNVVDDCSATMTTPPSDGNFDERSLARSLVPGRWPTKISDKHHHKRLARTSSAKSRQRTNRTTLMAIVANKCSGSTTTTTANANATKGSKSEPGVISLISFLIILAHICQILLPPSTSGQLVSVALAQQIEQVTTSGAIVVDAVEHDDNSNHANRQHGYEQRLVPRQPRSTLDVDYHQQATPPSLVAQNGDDDGGESRRLKQEAGGRDLRDAGLSEKLLVNMSNVFEVLLKKRPYSKYWTVEQKWDDLFKRGMAVQGTMRQMMVKNFMRDIEYYADMTLSPQCAKDLQYIQNYVSRSTNFRWLAHMLDSTGKSEPGMLTGMLAQLGHPVQCIRARAPARFSNDTFDERFFEQQTRELGERFRGKYCVASVRPVMPAKPVGVPVSRFSEIMNLSKLSNISYTGEPQAKLKQRSRQLTVPANIDSLIDHEHLRLDQVPFESELYQYLIAQRNFMFTLPRFTGVCYPSSCTRDDVRISLQKTLDDQHQVVDIEFECEQEEVSTWHWYNTSRLMAYVLLTLICGMVFLASFTRYVILSKLHVQRSKLAPDSSMASLLNALDLFSMDKCAGILFVKTKRASPMVDWTKVENNRSTTIDALRGSLILLLVYSQMIVLGCLPVPFMWAKWSDAMFPFFRSMITQVFTNMSIWSEAFYMISAYLIALKTLENYRPKLSSSPLVAPLGTTSVSSCRLPDFFSFIMKRYVRLTLPMLAFLLGNYVWPRLSNGFVMQDQASKLMKPCDSFGWTNFLMFHNYNQLNETCLWPSHVSASFFQLHMLSYPILVLCIMALYNQYNLDASYDENKGRRKAMVRILTGLAFGLMVALALFGAIYPALQASAHSLIVPFLIDYIDYDNYQRVIERTVLPTYNHLTSYMFGLALAFIVIRRKASIELRRLEASQWYSGPAGQYNQRAGSVESIRSSSTQELHQDSGPFKQPFVTVLTGSPNSSSKNNHGDQQALQTKHFNISSGESSTCDASSDHREEQVRATLDRSRSRSSGRFIMSFGCFVVCLGSLMASWLWNGLGQPMSNEQTFWYMILTKLCFSASFAYLFHEHFATRRNSSNPWILTRFLVPIGRMSLVVFYVSWLVIWFDLLSSLYQWHPSHYFICEKYNEIIFITLVIAMLVYGAFEGIVKRLQYSSRLAKVKHDIRLRMSLAAGVAITTNEHQRRRQHAFKVKPFESFFDPSDKPTWEELSIEYQLDKEEENKSLSSGFVIMDQLTPDAAAIARSRPAYLKSGLGTGGAGGEEGSVGQLSRVSTSSNLSRGDRYKLNAELRANYSFASIGLYEFAGATGDLSNLSNTSDPQDRKR